MVQSSKGIQGMGIVYGQEDQVLHCYVDADDAKCLDTRKSTSGLVKKLNGCPVGWASKKQQPVAPSRVYQSMLRFMHL